MIYFISTSLVGGLYSQCIGDLNQDTQVDIEDIVLSLNHIIGDEELDESILHLADFNLDGTIDLLDIISTVNLIINNNPCFAGITETNSSGEYTGNIDEDDWCIFDFNTNNSNTGYGLNPIYPNPVSSQEWGPFGDSYQICYQYLTPFDSTWSNFNTVDISIIGTLENQVYLYQDTYSNGATGICAYIPDSVITSNTIYRMSMQSGEFNCIGDIYFIDN